MKNILIQNYINRLSINDINNFAVENNIALSSTELNYLYNLIKNDYKTILYGNREKFFTTLKNNLSLTNYNEITKLYDIYKDKYNYLL